MSGTTAVRRRDALCVLLATTTGATDATLFERVGHVFGSVITGNLIIFGISLVHNQKDLLLFGSCALGGYGLGVFLGTPRGRSRSTSPKLVWPASATAALCLEMVLLVAFGVLWETHTGVLTKADDLIMLVLGASAMGAQSAAVRRLGTMSTTYLTSTLTALVESLAMLRWEEGHGRSLMILVAALIGAAGGVELVLRAERWLPALQLVPLVIVVLGSVPIWRTRVE